MTAVSVSDMSGVGPRTSDGACVSILAGVRVRRCRALLEPARDQRGGRYQQGLVAHERAWSAPQRAASASLHEAFVRIAPPLVTRRDRLLVTPAHSDEAHEEEHDEPSEPAKFESQPRSGRGCRQVDSTNGASYRSATLERPAGDVRRGTRVNAPPLGPALSGRRSGKERARRRRPARPGGEEVRRCRRRRPHRPRGHGR